MNCFAVGHLNGTYGYDDRNMDNTVVNKTGNDNDNENETENNNQDNDIDVDDDVLDEWTCQYANSYKMSYDTEAGTTDYTDGDMMGDGMMEEDDDEDFYGLADLRRDCANGSADDSESYDSSTEEVDVSDLVLRMILNVEEKTTVYDLLRADEAMVNAAFEIYDQDGDNNTMKRVVSRYLRQAAENVEEESVAERVFDALRRNGTISGRRDRTVYYVFRWQQCSNGSSTRSFWVGW